MPQPYRFRPWLWGLLIVFLSPAPARSQVVQSWYQVTLGATVNLHHNLGKRAFRNNFPGIKAFAGFSAANKLYLRHERMHGLFNFGINIAIYNKSLGNSLNVLYQDNQIDLTSSFSMGMLYNAGQPYLRQLQSINNVPFYNLRHDGEYAAIFSSNFILNNHRRHQTVGAVSLTAGQFSMNYYNDGGPVIGWGLGDKFDRWWTGGLGFYIHLPEGYNRAELHFDQFTGYDRLVFELGSILGTDVQDYDLFRSFSRLDTGATTFNLVQPRNYAYNFNSSAYTFRYFFSPQIGFNAGIIGSLRDMEKELFFALQDLIHLARRDPLHPNKDVNRLFYGISFYERFEVR